MTTTKARQTELIREFHRKILTEKDFDAVDELLAEGYVEHNPAVPGGELRGRAAAAEFWERLFDAFPDLEVVEEDVIVEDDTVVTRHVGRGTHEGEFMNVDPTGNRFEIGGIDIFRIEDGEIAEAWVNIDVLGMMEQLEALPEEATELG